MCVSAGGCARAHAATRKISQWAVSSSSCESVREGPNGEGRSSPSGVRQQALRRGFGQWTCYPDPGCPRHCKLRCLAVAAANARNGNADQHYRRLARACTSVGAARKGAQPSRGDKAIIAGLPCALAFLQCDRGVHACSSPPSSPSRSPCRCASPSADRRRTLSLTECPAV
jgi:hypothetical protein